jgi:hypothetical protein
MRSSVAGGMLVLVLIGALFAAVFYGSRQTQKMAGKQGPDPSQSAAQIKKDFTGSRLIGDWNLSCELAREPPKTLRIKGRPSRTSSRTSHQKAPLSADWKIPRCRAYSELSVPDDPQTRIRITLRQVGLKRVLSLFLRLPLKDVAAGDKVSLRLDRSARLVPVHSCERTFCLVIEPIGKTDASRLMAEKPMVVAFTARPTGKQVVAAVPTNGLAPAIAAMCRIDR